MEISSLNAAACRALADTNLLPAVEGRLSNLLNTCAPGNLRHELEGLIRQLPPDQREILIAKLNDPNDGTYMACCQQLPSGEMQTLMSVLNGGSQLLAQTPQTIHCMAARGDLDAMSMDDGTRFTIDQWNNIRSSGNPPDVPAMAPVSATQADAMLAAAGFDRSQPVSVKDYLALFNRTTPDAIHARAAQGDPSAIDFDDGSQFTVNQWNYYRSHGNPPDVPSMGTIGAAQTDAMIAAGGLDPDTPISVTQYLALFGQSTPETIHGRAAGGDPDAIALDDGSGFTIDEWNYFRANTNPDLALSSEQTDAMLAAAGLDREAPISVKDYLELIDRTRTEEVSEPQPEASELEARIFAARMRVEG
jgi:hypothetical protein